jgi:hypothetical protein
MAGLFTGTYTLSLLLYFGFGKLSRLRFSQRFQAPQRRAQLKIRRPAPHSGADLRICSGGVTALKQMLLSLFSIASRRLQFGRCQDSK